ncbi:MAG: asparagine synthase (glutamine-hydrolyzing) [Patescibacteria group bacterium]
MCGIAGCITTKKSASKAHVESMLEALKHRGPDSSGRVYAMVDHVKFGMTRLAIIDVKTGQQPFYSEDGKIAIVANGEIYNYQELKKKLKRKHRFVSKSDIEIILHLYEEVGLDVFKLLKGMFAIAIYDKRLDKLILARDRWGEKPLYYSIANRSLYFSSELKSLLKIKKIDRDLNLDAINTYFHYYYIPEWQTAFKNVYKLDAGSYAVINAKDLKIKIKRYWNPSKELLKRKNLKEKIRKAFIKACERTMLADVPVGLTLSGGFDSAAVAAALAPKYASKLTTFTVGYEGLSPTDERYHAKKLADHFGMKNVSLELKDKDVLESFPAVVIAQDDPIADIAAAGVDAVSKLAHKHGMKVLINGAGGDELFWGYLWVRKSLQSDVSKKNKKPVFGKSATAFTKTKQFTSKLFSKTFKSKLDNKNISPKLFSNSVSQISRYYMDRIRDMWLQPDVLVIGDRMGMRHAIETRSPLVDADLTDLLITTEQSVMAWKKGHKYWMRKALSNRVPKFVFNKKKQGFTPPVGRWLLKILWRYMYLLDNDCFLVKYKILDKNKLKLARIFWIFLPIYWYQYYQLLVLEIWGRHYVMGQKISDFK